MLKFSSRKELLYRLLFITVCVAIGMTIPRYLTISTSTSLKQRVFWLVKTPDLARITVGDYVRVPHTDAITGWKSIMLLKRVTCIENDNLRVDTDKNYFCNEAYLGRAKDRSKAGVPVANFKFNGPIPAEMLFVMGDHIDSYDSRYIGFIEKTRVVGQAYPIF